MAFATTDDAVRLYYEETGSGSPIIFVHEFAGDHRSWEQQLTHFGRRFRAITYAARGYPPSDVPEDPASYSQSRAADDILVVLDHLGIQKAHVCGLSLGGFATLHFGLRHPSRALSLCVAGCGYGAELNMREQFRAEADAVVASLRADGMAAFASRYDHGPTRVQHEANDPRGFAVVNQAVAEHSASGPANTQLGCQKERPAVPSAKRDGRPHSADADPHWRRGLALPGARVADEAHHPVGGSLGDAELRAYH